jgi:hypothetical protein
MAGPYEADTKARTNELKYYTKRRTNLLKYPPAKVKDRGEEA